MTIPVLEKGYVKLVRSWGSEEEIIEAARMSTNKGFQGWGRPHLSTCPASTKDSFAACVCAESEIGFKPGDERLLKYLWTHRHTSPFEMAGAIFEIYAPIFVVREWQRHRVQALSEGLSFNEMSGRYTELPDDYYIPTIDRIKASKQSSKNKQSSEEGFTDSDAHILWNQMQASVLESRRAYEHLLNQGVAREVARMVLPVNQYSRMRASANLWGWLHFLELRLAPNAQWEIREFARAVGEMLKGVFPRTYGLFSESL